MSFDPESCKHTVFSTYIGLFCYKRLNFGDNSAGEIFQLRNRSSMSGLQGVIYSSDDIIFLKKNKKTTT